MVDDFKRNTLGQYLEGSIVRCRKNSFNY